MAEDGDQCATHGCHALLAAESAVVRLECRHGFCARCAISNLARAMGFWTVCPACKRAGAGGLNLEMGLSTLQQVPYRKRTRGAGGGPSRVERREYRRLVAPELVFMGPGRSSELKTALLNCDPYCIVRASNETVDDTKLAVAHEYGEFLPGGFSDTVGRFLHRVAVRNPLLRFRTPQ